MSNFFRNVFYKKHKPLKYKPDKMNNANKFVLFLQAICTISKIQVVNATLFIINLFYKSMFSGKIEDNFF